ncbi:uncharacterized protein LOC112516778 [Cynara cardunculus var. scolymus]|uniref:uncharacterized protein LOC112516778 n=1 Tax=Cynara cardunculus var. scolymus TaxID=59895 RepID=UPI000D629CB1|nr:uncharacterized protein LOC112516778 [Cynara cardunculus var. scolymus]
MAFARQTFAFIFIFVHIIFAPSSAAKTRLAFSSTLKARSTPSPTAGPAGKENKEIPPSPTEDPAKKEDEGFPLPDAEMSKMFDNEADVVSFVTNKMEETQKMVTNFSENLKKRKDDPNHESGMKECFSECDEVMGAALDDIKNTLDSIKSQNFVKANFDISAVLTNVDTCEDCFAESVGGDAEAKKLLAHVQNLTGEALDALQSTQPPG